MVKLNEKRMILVEKLSKKVGIKPSWIFLIGLTYTYFFEYILANYFLNVPINNRLIIGASAWFLLWVIAIYGMFKIRDISFKTIDDLKDNGYYDDQTADDLKDKFLNYKLIKKPFNLSVKSFVYFSLSTMLFLGIINSTIKYFNNPGIYAGHNIIEKGVYVNGLYLGIVHWMVVVPLTFLIFDLIVIFLSTGKLTSDILKEIEGNIDFIHSDGKGGLNSIGRFMSSTVLVFFVCLALFSILLGIYNAVIYYVYITIGWVIGSILIWYWHRMVYKVVKEDKEKKIDDIISQIRDLHEKGDDEKDLIEELRLQRLFLLQQNIKDTNDYVVDWRILIYTIIPIIISYLDFILEHFNISIF